MARWKDRQKAIDLRKRGCTYSEIKRKLGLSKSTLSNWLSNCHLTEEELGRLQKAIDRSKDLAIERCRLTKQRKRDTRLESLYQEEKERWLSLSKRELYLSGLFLYWGEGAKSLKGSLSLNNTDPKVVKFYLYWLTEVLKISRDKIKVYVHLYSDMDIERELDFWSRGLKIPRQQFNNPYIKRNKRVGIDHKGFGHGTCALTVNNVRLKERVMMGLRAVADYYGERV